MLLENPPLVEVVFEAIFGDGDWTQARVQPLVEQMRKRVVAGQLQTQHEHAVLMHVQGANLSVGTQIGTEPKRYRVVDESNGITIGGQVFSVHVLKDYKGLNKHLPTFLDLYPTVIEQTGARAPIVFGQRFINRIETAAKSAPRDYFRVYPQMPGDVEGKHLPFAMQVEVARWGTGFVVMNMVRDNDGQAYVLDLYARATEPLPPATAERWMREANKWIVASFKSAVTDDYLQSRGVLEP